LSAAEHAHAIAAQAPAAQARATDFGKRSFNYIVAGYPVKK
jgi:hypothetical protein